MILNIKVQKNLNLQIYFQSLHNAHEIGHEIPVLFVHIPSELEIRGPNSFKSLYDGALIILDFISNRQIGVQSRGQGLEQTP